MKPAGGSAGPGKPFDPRKKPEPAGEEPDSSKPRPAPAPGVPIAPEEFERLKERVRRTPPPKSVPAQTDPSEDH